MKWKHQDSTPALALAGIAFLAFLPVSTFTLAIKNDFFFGYYPAKHFLTQSIRAAEFPLWNPFLNYGFPVYGDMSVSYWSPVTWLFAMAGYNAYSFTLEQLLYILAAGFGMYRYLGLWINGRATRVAGAVTYMCSGFIVGHLQHFNFVSAAGMLPWLMFSLHNYLLSCGKKDLLELLLWLVLFITGSYPGLVIGSIFFILPYVIWVARTNKLPLGGAAGRLALAALIALAVLAGTIWGYSSVITETNRSAPVTEEMMSDGFTDAGSWLSFLAPVSVYARDTVTTTDPSFRNNYIGILFLPLLLSMFFFRPKGVQLLMLWLGVIFLWLSSPYFFPGQQRVPLLNFVRLPGIFRLFAIFSFIVTAFIQLSRFSTMPHELLRVLKWTAGLFLLAGAGVAILKGGYIMDYFSELANISLTRHDIRSFVQSIPINAATMFHCIFGLVMLTIMGFFIQQQKWRLLYMLICADMVIMSLACLPFTGVGVTTVAEVQALLDKSPHGAVRQSMEPEKTISARYPETEKIIGDWAWYSKQVALQHQVYYPLRLNSTEHYFADVHRQLHHKPFAFSTAGSAVAIRDNGFHFFQLEVDAPRMDTVLIKQNFFPAWEVRVDGKPSKAIGQYNDVLIGTAVAPGEHRVTFTFKQPLAIALFAYQQVAFIIILLLLFIASGTSFRSRS